VLAIHPLLWADGWPVAGEPFKDGVYEISSVRRGYALELAVDFVRHDIPRSRFWMIDPDEPVVSYPNQTLEEVAAACRVCVQQRQLQVGV
jgi:arabinan endo-1,5-alpha-L-arabinosidase